MTTHPHVRCQICGQEFHPTDTLLGELLRPTLASFIHERHPGFDPHQAICNGDLGALRRAYVEHNLREERGELTELDQEVVESLRQHELLSSNLNEEVEATTFGERLSDKIAAFGGSWSFIMAFAVFMALWTGFNSFVLKGQAFDPYPYILLNLGLSCIAALQAPVIMMSQNRSEARDRRRAENDYKINLKAELEIRHLHEKLDHLLRRQYNRLMETHQIQIELLEELARAKKRKPAARKH